VVVVQGYGSNHHSLCSVYQCCYTDGMLSDDEA
jgi:hypothetical protein